MCIRDRAVVDYLWNALKIIITNLGPLFVEAFKEVINNVMYIQYRLAKAIDLIGASLSDVFMGVAEKFVNALIAGINKAIDTINLLPGIKIDLLKDVSFATNKAAGVAASTGSYEDWKAQPWSGALKANPAVDIGKQLSNYFKESIANTGALFEKLGAPFKGIFDVAKEKMDAILNRQQEAAVVVAETIASAQPSSEQPMMIYEGTMAGEYTLPSSTPSLQTNTDIALSPLFEAFASLGDIGNIFTQLSGAVGPLVSAFGMLSPLINWGATIMKGMMQVLAPIIDSLLKPLIGILIIVGRVLGSVLAPVLQTLTPVIELISKAFVFLYNYAIRPLANAIIWVISTIYNVIASVVNGIITAINSIPGVNIGWRMAAMDYDSMALGEIQESDLSAAGESYDGGAGGGSTPGSSASYTGPSIKNFNFYIDNTNSLYMDKRDLALLIRAEIDSCEALGL